MGEAEEVRKSLFHTDFDSDLSSTVKKFLIFRKIKLVSQTRVLKRRGA